MQLCHQINIRSSKDSICDIRSDVKAYFCGALIKVMNLFTRIGIHIPIFMKIKHPRYQQDVFTSVWRDKTLAKSPVRIQNFNYSVKPDLTEMRSRSLVDSVLAS